MRATLVLLGCFAAASAATPPFQRPSSSPTMVQAHKRHTAAPKPSLMVVAAEAKRPSFKWAILSNWLYFLSLGMNAVNMAFLCRQITDGTTKPSPASILLSGNIEAVDKILTFLGVASLAALSDVHGRKPLMAWSAIGFGLTNLIQATATGPKALYLADLIDGCSSCMTPVCQAYVADCSAPADRAANLGIFQGLSIGMAFIFAFPIGGILGTKFGPRVPLRIAAGLQMLNALIIILVTPEANPRSARAGRVVDWRAANPIGAMWRLFGRAPLLRSVATTYALVTLARNALDAQFINYASVRFGWSSQQTGPVMVIVGLMLAIAPRVLVPLLGLRRAIVYGAAIFSAGLLATGLSPNPAGFVGGLFVVSVGCVCIPALQALLTNLAPPGEKGALLGALGSLTELDGAIGSRMYAAILASFVSDTPPLPGMPGMHFFVASALMLVALAVAAHAFKVYAADAQKAADGPAADGADLDVM